MNQSRKRLISLALALVILLCLCACSSSVTTLMDDGANRFAMGKDEENYSPKNSGALLESLIEQFSGSYHTPSSARMDDDDYDDAKEKADASGGNVSDGTPSGGDPAAGETTDDDGSTDGSIRVSNREELLQAFYTAFSSTSTYLAIETENGFTFDPSADFLDCYTELQRDDPISVGSVKQWKWGNQRNSYVFEIVYTMDVEELIAIKAATEALVEAAAAQIDIMGKTDYEIIYAVNEYLCDTVYYPESEPYAPVTHTAYGALQNGVAVCEGYACAAKLILNELGIRCDIQIGTCIDGGGHAWNLVELDGQWYQMDVTWNDGSADRTDYLLVTDDYMRKSRTWDAADYPACATTPYIP